MLHLQVIATILSIYYNLTETNKLSYKLPKEISLAVKNYIPCENVNCTCYKIVSDNDFRPFGDEITKEQFKIARARGTKYQVT